MHIPIMCKCLCVYAHREHTYKLYAQKRYTLRYICLYFCTYMHREEEPWIYVFLLFFKRIRFYVNSKKWSREQKFDCRNAKFCSKTQKCDKNDRNLLKTLKSDTNCFTFNFCQKMHQIITIKWKKTRHIKTRNLSTKTYIYPISTYLYLPHIYLFSVYLPHIYRKNKIFLFIKIWWSKNFVKILCRICYFFFIFIQIFF